MQFVQAVTSLKKKRDEKRSTYLYLWGIVIAQRFGIASMKFEFAVQERDVGLQDAIKTPKLQ